MDIKTVELLKELNELRKARGYSEAYLASGVAVHEDTGKPFVGYELKYADKSGLMNEEAIQRLLEKQIKVVKTTPF